ncbi:MAG: hypothetical protein D6814_04535 [Calditrichaeota bacterium]|nr:MAG: hypothetical protein D6814_04535 [Calditrichota bacterium]
MSGRKQKLEHVQFVHLGVDPQEEVGSGHRFSQRIFRLLRAEPAGGSNIDFHIEKKITGKNS